jgi:putative transposase
LLGAHLVWCQKDRRRVLGGRVAARCGELLEQGGGGHGCQIVAMPVHVFVRVGPTDAPSQMVRVFKGGTGGVLGSEFSYMRRVEKVLWSPSYLAAALDYVWESTVRRDIEHQWDAVAS